MKETCKGHGRLEERTLTVSSQPNDILDWPYLQQVFRMERRLRFTKTGEIQEQVVYGVPRSYLKNGKLALKPKLGASQWNLQTNNG